MPPVQDPRHAPESHVDNWLETVFRNAENARWCTRPFCTTCGCQEFRRAYLSGAAIQAGLPVRFQAPRHPRRVFEDCSAHDQRLLVQALIQGLRRVSARWSNSDAIRTVLVDLQSYGLGHAHAAELLHQLRDTPAGVGMMLMREHAERQRERSLRHEQFNSALAVEERERLRREQAAQRHATRQTHARQRGQERLQLLASLAKLPMPDRLACLARDESIRLGMVTDAVLAVQHADLSGLGRAETAALVGRIGKRGGGWGRLRRLLEQRLAAEW